MWQKLSARRNSSSEIHFRRSTTSKCINPIWPTGPPKANQPRRKKYQKTSPTSAPAAVDGATALLLIAVLLRFLLLCRADQFGELAHLHRPELPSQQRLHQLLLRAHRVLEQRRPAAHLVQRSLGITPAHARKLHLLRGINRE